MYSQNTIPAAATGITLTAAAIAFNWITALFLLCAAFAIIGAISAVKRILPVPAFIRTNRNRKNTQKLNQRLNRSK